MAYRSKNTKHTKGGEWLIKESDPSETLTPEDFNEEQRW